MNFIRVLAPIGAIVAAGGLFVSAASADSNTQTASNSASSTQASAAVSGNATSTNEAVATTGGAFALSLSGQYQSVFQAAANSADELEDTNTQSGANTATTDQSSAAVSGIADAAGAGESHTGFVESIADNYQDQWITQLAFNGAPVDGGGMVNGGGE